MTDKPLDHMVPVDSTGLQETAPVRNESGEFEDTPTSLDITRASASTPLYARLTARIEPVGGPTLDGAYQIWTSSDPADNVTRYFRKSFTVDEVPNTAQLVFNADDAGTVYVNGEQVAGSDEWWYAPVVDVADALTTGENVIAVEVEQGGGGAGLAARLELGEDRVVVTDDTWLAAESASGDWMAPDFDDSGWSSAVVTAEYGNGWGGYIDIENVQLGKARIALVGPSGKKTEYTDPATIGDGVGIRSTGWVKVPADFNDGTARLQVSNARVTVVTLELAVRNDI